MAVVAEPAGFWYTCGMTASANESSSVQRIAWIGTGVMGVSMAGHLLDAGYDLTVHTRTKSKSAGLLERGAIWAETPAEAADGADAAISIVGYPDDVEQTHLGPAGTLAAPSPPPILVDMTTSRPSLARQIADEAERVGAASLDAPVSGGDIGAREARLSIMVGGPADAFERLRPVLDRLGTTVVYHGPAGSGQHVKMVNQILVAGTMMSTCEALLYAGKAGLDPRRVIDSVGSGAAGSWTINNLGPRIIDRDFDPGFYVEHFIKDLGIALDEAATMKLSLPGLAQARHLYEAVRAQGHGRLGTQALMLVFEQLNGLGGSS